MAIEISMVRHGQTKANVAGIWQGTTNSDLTHTGQRQVECLGKRYATSSPGLVLTSNLGRARDTAAVFGPAEIDERWRELHLGEWEGLTQAEIDERYPGEFAAASASGDVSFGGGETTSEMKERLVEAFFDLAGRLRDGERATVVTHGGAILTLLGAILGINMFGKVSRLANTAICNVLIGLDDVPRLVVFNDSTHLPKVLMDVELEGTHVVLVRHGETFANLEGRWQGQSPGELTPRGRSQALSLIEHFPPVDVFFTSPLTRAKETALLIAGGSRLIPEEVHAFSELGFGRWEMLTVDEIRDLDPLGLKEIEAGHDIRRGRIGETFGEVRDRFRDTLEELVEQHCGSTIGVVSHGAAIRAFATDLLGLSHPDRRRIGLLRNTAMARVVYGSEGPALAAWNIAPHLES